jgi:hypothetical protein
MHEGCEEIKRIGGLGWGGLELEGLKRERFEKNGRRNLWVEKGWVRNAEFG